MHNTDDLQRQLAELKRLADGIPTELPMVLDGVEPNKSYDVKYKAQNSIKERQDNKSMNRGNARHIALTETRSGDEVINDSGQTNIVDVCYDGIQEPIVLSVAAFRFCSKYNILNGATLVMNEECKKGNVALLDLGGKYAIAKFDGEKFKDIADSAIYKQEDVAEIMGSLYGKFEKF